MAKRNLTARIHMLSVREVVAASDGILTDGGGLVRRIADGRASWVFRYTTAAGKRREAHRAFKWGLKMQPDHEGILADVARMGLRRRPVLPAASRRGRRCPRACASY